MTLTAQQFIKITEGLRYKAKEGNLFSVSQVTALDAFDIAAPLTYEITTFATDPLVHLLVGANSGLGAVLSVYEDDGVVAHYNVSGGTGVTPDNRNRLSTRIPNFSLRSGMTVTAATADALIYSRLIGGVVVGGALFATETNEFVLKIGTKYLVQFVSQYNDNEGSLNLELYQ